MSDLLTDRFKKVKGKFMGKAPRHVQCVLCGRKFVYPVPHKCATGYLVHYNRSARIRGLKTIFQPIQGGTEKAPLLVPNNGAENDLSN